MVPFCVLSVIMFKVFRGIYLLKRFLSILSLISPEAMEFTSFEWCLFEVLEYILFTARSLSSSCLPLNDGGPEDGETLRPLAFPDS